MAFSTHLECNKMDQGKTSSESSNNRFLKTTPAIEKKIPQQHRKKYERHYYDILGVPELAPKTKEKVCDNTEQKDMEFVVIEQPPSHDSLLTQLHQAYQERQAELMLLHSEGHLEEAIYQSEWKLLQMAGNKLTHKNGKRIYDEDFSYYTSLSKPGVFAMPWLDGLTRNFIRLIADALPDLQKQCLPLITDKIHQTDTLNQLSSMLKNYTTRFFFAADQENNKTVLIAMAALLTKMDALWQNSLHHHIDSQVVPPLLKQLHIEQQKLRITKTEKSIQDPDKNWVFAETLKQYDDKYGKTLVAYDLDLLEYQAFTQEQQRIAAAKQQAAIRIVTKPAKELEAALAMAERLSQSQLGIEGFCQTFYNAIVTVEKCLNQLTDRIKLVSTELSHIPGINHAMSQAEKYVSQSKSQYHTFQAMLTKAIVFNQFAKNISNSIAELEKEEKHYLSSTASYRDMKLNLVKTALSSLHGLLKDIQNDPVNTLTDIELAIAKFKDIGVVFKTDILKKLEDFNTQYRPSYSRHLAFQLGFFKPRLNARSLIKIADNISQVVIIQNPLEHSFRR